MKRPDIDAPPTIACSYSYGYSPSEIKKPFPSPRTSNKSETFEVTYLSCNTYQVDIYMLQHIVFLKMSWNRASLVYVILIIVYIAVLVDCKQLNINKYDLIINKYNLS